MMYILIGLHMFVFKNFSRIQEICNQIFCPEVVFTEMIWYCARTFKHLTDQASKQLLIWTHLLQNVIGDSLYIQIKLANIGECIPSQLAGIY